MDNPKRIPTLLMARRHRYGAVNRGRSRANVLPTLKLRSSVRAVPYNKFVRKRFPMPAVYRRKKRSGRRKFSNVANNDLFRTYPRHVFMRDLEDFLQDCREQSDRESVKTDSISFWQEEECCSDAGEAAQDASSVHEEMNLDESSRLEDDDDAVNSHLSESDKSSDENVPVLLSDPETNDDVGCSGYGKASVIGSDSRTSFCENDESTLPSCSGTDVALCDSATSSDVEDGMSAKVSSDGWEEGLVLGPSKEEYEELYRGISCLPGSGADQYFYLDESGNLISKMRPSKVFYNDLRLKLNMIRKLKFKTKHSATDSPDINSGVFYECEIQPSGSPSRGKKRLVEMSLEQNEESSNFSDLSDCEIAESRRESLSVKVSHLKHFDSNVAKQYEMQLSVPLPREKKPCFEMFGDQNVQSINITEKSERETAKCQDLLSSKTIPVECLDSDIVKQCEMFVDQILESIAIAEKSDRKTLEFRERLPSKACPVQCLDSDAVKHCEMSVDQNLESNTIAEKSDHKNVECQEPRPSKVSPLKYLDSDVFEECETPSPEKKMCIEMSVDQNVESSDVVEESNCEIVECRKEPRSSKVLSIKYVVSDVCQECEMSVDQNVEYGTVAEKSDRETAKCQGEPLESKASPLEYLDSDAFYMCEVPPSSSPSRGKRTYIEISLDQTFESIDVIAELSNCEIIECQGESLSSEASLLKYHALEANKASVKPSASNVREITDVLQSETIPSKTFEYSNVCSEIKEDELKEALEYISECAQNDHSDLSE